MAAMLIYITWAFRKVPHSFRYGTATVVAVVFNLLVTFGVFSLVGRFVDWEVDPMFITALLAIIGYSVNDSIVVLDRIRENKARGIGGDYDGMINLSISETLVRSLNTAITTVLAVLAVYLIVGGPYPQLPYGAVRGHHRRRLQLHLRRRTVACHVGTRGLDQAHPRRLPAPEKQGLDRGQTHARLQRNPRRNRPQ